MPEAASSAMAKGPAGLLTEAAPTPVAAKAQAQVRDPPEKQVPIEISI